MEEKSRNNYIVQAEMMLLAFLIVFGAMKRLSSGTLVNAEAKTGETSERGQTASGKEDYIRWVDFDVSCEALSQAYDYDIGTYMSDAHVNWIELLAYLAVQYGGDFSCFKEKDMTEAVEKIQAQGIEALTADLKYYDYYLEAYEAVLGGMVGVYEAEQPTEVSEETESGSGTGTGGVENTVWKQVYGLKAFSPIAKGFPYSEYDDFGASRSYGYQRTHLGHDILGQVGTPIIAIEGGTVRALGWNQFGGWRIGIDSFDGKRYYYYAHLRQDRPYAEGLEEGDIVQAGDVIGYMGRTGYSAEENTNNIDVYHLHLGMQLIFDESQREGTNEIWIDVYPLTRFLARHASETVRNDETKEWSRRYQIRDPEIP